MSWKINQHLIEHTRNLEIHKAKAKKFYSKLNDMTKLAKENDEVDVLCFDFKQNMPLPHLQTSDVFYMRQLWLYVLSMYSGKTGKSIMYCWPETEARRGANEVISVLDHYINSFLKPTVKKLFIFTDNCRGQNQNNTVLRYWQTLVIQNKFELITHYFPERGHSFLPCDRHFGIIEKLQRKCERAETIDDWVELMNLKFKIVHFPGLLVKDYVTELEKYF